LQHQQRRGAVLSSTSTVSYGNVLWQHMAVAIIEKNCILETFFFLKVLSTEYCCSWCALKKEEKITETGNFEIASDGWGRFLPTAIKMLLMSTIRMLC
jgi:hypothetical protein